jgi:Arc/MetJ family transcription regulator
MYGGCFYYSELVGSILTCSFIASMCMIQLTYTHRRAMMRTNIVLNDSLMESALKVSESKTKKGAIEEALKLLVQMKSQVKVKEYRGKLKWTGNLDESRSDK